MAPSISKATEAEADALYERFCERADASLKRFLSPGYVEKAIATAAAWNPALLKKRAPTSEDTMAARETEEVR